MVAAASFNRDAEGAAAVRLAPRVNDDRQTPTPSATCEDSLLVDSARRLSSLSRVGDERRPIPANSFGSRLNDFDTYHLIAGPNLADAGLFSECNRTLILTCDLGED